MALETWVIFSLRIVFLLVAAHMTITIILPKLKKVLVEYTDNENLAAGSMMVLISYTAIFVLVKIFNFMIATDNTYLKYSIVALPAFEVLLDILPYVVWFFVALVIVSGMKDPINKKNKVIETPIPEFVEKISEPMPGRKSVFSKKKRTPSKKTKANKKKK